MAATVYDYKSGDELGIVNDAVYVKYLEEIAGSHTGVVEGLDFGFAGLPRTSIIPEGRRLLPPFTRALQAPLSNTSDPFGRST